MSLLTPVLTTEPVKDPNVIQRNPAVTVASVIAIVNFLLQIYDPLLALLAVFGVVITPETSALITNILAFILSIAAGFITKQYVTPLAAPKNADGEKLEPA